MARTIAISNQKGGVGKTTSVVNLASSMALMGQKVLVVDLDPQANASSSFGVFSRNELHTSSAILIDESPVEICIQPTEVNNLDIVPSSQSLSGIELELTTLEQRESRLKGALEAIVDDYDYILVDTPPTLGLLTVNALISAQSVLIPLQPEYLALEGLTQLLNTIASIRKCLNPRLEIEGILLTMCDRRNNLARQVENDVRNHFPEVVFQSTIPRNVKLSEAPSHGMPIMCYDFKSTGSKAYLDFTKELLLKHSQMIPKNLSRRDVSEALREITEGI